MFLGMPASPTSASNWLNRLRWKEIFSSSWERSIAKKIEPFLGNIDSYKVCHESGWPHFVIWGVFISWSFYYRQSHQLARPINWLGLYERKYSHLVVDEVLVGNFEPFLRNSISNIGMSCKLMAIYRHIRLFPLIDVHRNASLTN